MVALEHECEISSAIAHSTPSHLCCDATVFSDEADLLRPKGKDRVTIAKGIILNIDV
jgi:hypothetical protein